MKPNKKGPIVVGIIVVLLILLAAGGVVRDKEPKKVVSDGTAGNTESTTAVAEKTKFSMGDTAELNGVQVTLLQVKETAGSDFLGPSDGNVFVACAFEIANHAENDINVSSMISFEAYCDDYAVNQSITGLTSLTQNGEKQLDGTVAPGKKMNGVICYEVPQDWESLEISYAPSFWGKAITFEAVKE